MTQSANDGATLSTFLVSGRYVLFRPRRWPWMLGLIAVLTIGVGGGVAIGMGQVPADDNPKVVAALDDIAEIRATESQRVAERESALGERSDALDLREEEIDEREEKLDEREGKLDKRKTSLDKRSADLDKRAKSIKAEERQIAANTVPGMVSSS